MEAAQEKVMLVTAGVLFSLSAAGGAQITGGRTQRPPPFVLRFTNRQEVAGGAVRCPLTGVAEPYYWIRTVVMLEQCWWTVRTVETYDTVRSP